MVALFNGTEPQVGGHDSLTVTWSLNFEAVKGASRASADLLNAIAFLASDAIPDELFLDGGAEISAAIGKVLKVEGDLAIGKLAAPLLRYSLVEREPEGHNLRVHRLVQEVIKASLGKTKLRILRGAVKALRRSFPWPEFATWARCERLLPHLLAIARVAEDGDLAWLLNDGAVYLWNRARFAEAEPLFERSRAIQESLLGGDHPNVAQSLNNLASLYRGQGRLAEAEPLYERSLAIWEKSLGGDHAHVAQSLNNLANVYRDQGRLAEAKPLYERSLAIREKALGGDHAHVAQTLNNLAILNRHQGRFAEAQLLHERSLAIREKTLIGDHPDVAQSLNNLAVLYRQQGRLAEAEPLFVRSLAIRDKSLGGDHPLVARSLEHLAGLRRKQGRDKEAEELETRAREVRARHSARNRKT